MLISEEYIDAVNSFLNWFYLPRKFNSRGRGKGSPLPASPIPIPAAFSTSYSVHAEVFLLISIKIFADLEAGVQARPYIGIHPETKVFASGESCVKKFVNVVARASFRRGELKP